MSDNSTSNAGNEPTRPQQPAGKRAPGVCIPWEERKAEMPPIEGDEELTRRVWEEIDGLGYMYIWHVLVSF